MVGIDTLLRARLVSAEALRAVGGPAVIDLRSPGEFAADHVPGALNAPLFDDAERALIGTLYARHSPNAAFAEGRARARAKIDGLARSISAAAGWSLPARDLGACVDEWTARGIEALEAQLAPKSAAADSVLPEGAVVFNCWRGGLRSRSVVALFRHLGFDAFALDGGYKAYRKLVRERLAGWQAPTAYVLRGLTGVGKTLVLRAMEALRPGCTLDLEGCAGHRSSILGMVGLEPCTQRMFESRLMQRTEAGFSGFVVFEGESRKVGDAIVPARIWEALDGGVNIELRASKQRRVQVLLDDYLAREENRSALRRQLPFIEERLGRNRFAGQLVARLDGREPELVELLLEHYYDPLYRHSEGAREYAVTISAENAEHAAAEVLSWIDAR